MEPETERNDPNSAEGLLPLVYDELRRLAASKLARESPNHTLQATALVHEAYARLVVSSHTVKWNGRGHFFAAAAEAMRRILVENARRKKRVRHGGECRRLDIDDVDSVAECPSDDLLELNDALERLARTDPVAAKLVELRYFVGLTMNEAAEALGLSLRSAERDWTYARTWLHRELSAGDDTAGT